MKKFFKIVGIIFGALVVLIILAAIILPRVIDINAFKPQITDIVRGQTGRELLINGDIELKILPRLSIELRDVTFSNAEGFAPVSMAKVGHASFGIALFPLLKKEIEVSRVILEDTEINYAVDAEGVSNIDDILALQAAKAKDKPEATESPVADEPQKAPFNLNNANIAVFRVANMTLSYADARTGVQYLLTNAGLEAEDVGLGKPVDLTLRADLQETKSKMAAELDLAATVSYEEQLVSASFTKLALTYSMQDTGLNVTANLAANTSYNLDTQMSALSDAVIDVKASMKSADFALDGDIHAEIPAVNFDLAKTALDLPSLNVSGGYTTSMIEGRQNLAATVSGVIFDVKQEALTLKALNLKTLGLSVDVAVSGTKVLSAPNIKGSVTVAEFSLRDLMKMLKIAYTPTDAAALTKVKLASPDFSFAGNILKAPLLLTLDDTAIHTNATVDLSKKKPVITASTDIDALVLDRYLPAPAPVATTTPEAQAGAAQTDNATQPAAPVKLEYPNIALDLSTLPDFTLSLKAGKIAFSDEGLTSLTTKIAGVNGIVTANLSTTMTDGARINADVRATAQKDKFDAAANINISSIDIHRILHLVNPSMDLTKMPKKGIVDASVSMANKAITVSKLNIAADTYTLTGNAKLDFTPPDKPLLTFKFDGNRVDMLNLFPKTGKVETAQEVQQRSDAATNAPDLNVIPVNAEGTVTIKTLTYDKIVVTALSAALKLNNGTVALAPLSGNVWGGSFIVNGSVSSKDGKLPAALKMNAANLKLAEFISDFKPDLKLFGGDITINADFTTKGVTMADIRTSINGRGDYSLKNGVVYGVGYNPNLLSLDTLRSFSLFSKDKSIAVNDTKGSVVFENGRVTFNQLDLKSQYVDGNIKGGIMLADYTLNFGGILNVESVEVPVTITGSFRDPKITIDQDKLISGLIIQYTKKTATGVITAPVKVPMDIMEGVGKGLENLFK